MENVSPKTPTPRLDKLFILVYLICEIFFILLYFQYSSTQKLFRSWLFLFYNLLVFMYYYAFLFLNFYQLTAVLRKTIVNLIIELALS